MLKRELKPIVPEASSPAQGLIDIIEDCIDKGSLVGREIIIGLRKVSQGCLAEDWVTIQYHDKARGPKMRGELFPEGQGQEVYDEMRGYFALIGLKVLKYKHVR